MNPSNISANSLIDELFDSLNIINTTCHSTSDVGSTIFEVELNTKSSKGLIRHIFTAKGDIVDLRKELESYGVFYKPDSLLFDGNFLVKIEQYENNIVRGFATFEKGNIPETTRGNDFPFVYDLRNKIFEYNELYRENWVKREDWGKLLCD